MCAFPSSLNGTAMEQICCYPWKVYKNFSLLFAHTCKLVIIFPARAEFFAPLLVRELKVKISMREVHIATIGRKSVFSFFDTYLLTYHNLSLGPHDLLKLIL